MKRLLFVLPLLGLFAVSYWWFSRRAAPPAAPAAAAAVTEDPRRKEREDLFGAEALAPDITWQSSGLGSRIVERGTDPKPGIGARVKLVYTGRLKDGTVFDRAEKPAEFLIGATIPGLSVGLQMLGTGGKATFFIPPSLGYGHRKVLGIPASSGLIFDVQVTEIAP